MMIAILLITFTIFLVLGVPIAFAMGLSGVIALFAASDISLLVLPQRDGRVLLLSPERPRELLDRLRELASPPPHR